MTEEQKLRLYVLQAARNILTQDMAQVMPNDRRKELRLATMRALAAEIELYEEENRDDHIP